MNYQEAARKFEKMSEHDRIRILQLASNLSRGCSCERDWEIRCSNCENIIAIKSIIQTYE